MRFDLRIKVECKELLTFEDAVRVAKEKERKQRRLAQLSDESSRAPNVSEGMAPAVLEKPRMEVRKEGTMQQEIHDMSEMMKNLSLNLLNGRGRTRIVNDAGAGRVSGSEPLFPGLAGRGRRPFPSNVQCFNCGD